VARPLSAPILVVDDDGRVLRACEELFSGAGYAVRTARTAEDALDEIRRRPPAALLTEIPLPGMDGLTLIRRARRLAPNVVAIVLTAHPSASAAARALRLGVDDYVIKHADSVGYLRRAVPLALRRRAHQVETSRLLADLADLNEEFLRNIAELEQANLELQAQLRPPPGEEGPFRILVVDDDEKIVALLETLLASQPGLLVTGVTSGAEARAELSSRRFDLVMADKNLGDDDGVDLIGEVHARHPDTAVLLMTAYATLESAVAAMHHGAVDYLQKPFPDLGMVVDVVLEVRRKVREEREKRRYVHSLQSRHTDFVARYRLIKNKLLTLQREPP
jgi:DNA-binding NtrC family response regulator